MKPFCLVLPATLLALASCATAPDASTGCTIGPVRLMQDFPTAPDYACTRTGPASFHLAVVPESDPINPSPWYAFDLETAAPVLVQVELDYGTFSHRYWPKIELSEGAWQSIDSEQLTISDDGHTALITLPLDPAGVRVAAQEAIGSAARAEWRRDFAMRHHLDIETIGHSLDGRAIEALSRPAVSPDAPLIVIIGGQHPPEVTGVLGLRTFLNALFADQPGLEEMDRFEWLIVPDLNPDGVEEGHWRENLGGMDLNRDWGPFEQRETAAIRDAILARAGDGHAPLLLLDFHSTHRDVLYTPPDDAGLTPANFSADWIVLLNANWPEDEGAFERIPGHNPGLPTAKSWFAVTFGAPGLTVEFGDETDRDRIAALAETAAIALLRYLVSVNAEPGLAED